MENKMKYIAVLLMFLTSACVVAGPPQPELRPDNLQLKQNTIPLMQSSRAIDHSYYAKSDFVDLTIPKDFQFVNTVKLKYLLATGKWRDYALFSDHLKKFNTTSNCKGRLKDFGIKSMTREVSSREEDYADAKKAGFRLIIICSEEVGGLIHLDYPWMADQMAEIILHHATERNVIEDGVTHMPSQVQYAKYMVMAQTAEFYAYFKDLMPLTPEEHKIITAYFDEIFMGNIFHPQERRQQCNVNTPMLIASSGEHGQHGCGTNGTAMLQASIAYSLSTNNNKLFERAKANLTYWLGTFDNDGIHVLQASRGASLGYHHDISIRLGSITEMMYALDYDFLEHTMPRSGIKVHDVLDTHFEALNNHQLMAKYGRHNNGVWDKWSSIANMTTTEANAYITGYDWWHIANANRRYVIKYRTEPTMMRGKLIDWQAHAKKDLIVGPDERVNAAGEFWKHALIPAQYMYEINQSR
jgi:hypothetical protein